MDLNNLRTKIAELEEAESYLAKLKCELATLDCRGQMETIKVTFGKIERNFKVVDVEFLREGGKSMKEIRGREMIALGIKKIYGSAINATEKQIAEIKQELKDLTNVG